MSKFTVTLSALLLLAVTVFHSAEGRACAGCFQKISVNDESLKRTLNMALTEANAGNYKVLKIISAERQVVAGFNYKVRFEAMIPGQGKKVCKISYFEGLKKNFKLKGMGCSK
ncbi:hypothetical protein O3M35_012869 [Rhynocoris fuscipes]|uniref:Cystatin domain-containing protein n=1 Tax=Rhynocoris fuscipes TaxID=488301 RepID=A0AAW1CKE2_9HEMI